MLILAYLTESHLFESSIILFLIGIPFIIVIILLKFDQNFNILS